MIEIMIIIMVAIMSIEIGRAKKHMLSASVLSSDETIIEAINANAVTMKVNKHDVDGILWDIKWTKVHQNNPHHLEGYLYNHIILMLVALKGFRDELSDTAYAIMERAIFWSDLGKYHTTKESPKKTWEDGTPTSTAFGHDKKSAELLDEAVSTLANIPIWYKPVRWLVMEHMQAHKLEEMDNLGKTSVPEFLKPQVEGLEAWDWPEWDELNIPHGESLSKKNYAWIRRGSSPLLRIKQQCDSEGRVSDLEF
jgi:hypothetical protein